MQTHCPSNTNYFSDVESILNSNIYSLGTSWIMIGNRILTVLPVICSTACTENKFFCKCGIPCKTQTKSVQADFFMTNDNLRMTNYGCNNYIFYDFI